MASFMNQTINLLVIPMCLVILTLMALPIKASCNHDRLAYTMLTLKQLIVAYGFRNAYLYPLLQYPGPLLWRSFRLPYVMSIHRGLLHNHIKEFHTTYGPIVRIAPNELSFADSAAWKDIYLNRPGHAPFTRSTAFTKKMIDNEPNSILGPNEDDHARFNRVFANSFSDKALRDQAPVIEGYVDLFINQLKALTPMSASDSVEETLDLGKWLNYLLFDISGGLSFGGSFDCLRSSKAHLWVQISQDFGKGLAMIGSINHYIVEYPRFNRLLPHIIPKKILQRALTHRKVSAAKVSKRLALDIDRPDFVTPAAKYLDAKECDLTTVEWQLNMTVIAFAASQTTSSALTAMMRELLTNPHAMRRLVLQIRDKFEDESVITIATATDLPYLNAVVNEGLRLDPTAVIGVPRIVSDGGDTVCGRWVPGGTFVTYNQYSASRQAYNFHEPNSFIPERFLDIDPADNMAAFQPFSVGQTGVSRYEAHVCRDASYADSTAVELRHCLEG
jgi:cytochrome P450